MLTLNGDILCIEFSSFYEFREFFGEWCLRRNGVGSNHLDTAEFGAVGGSLVAIKYLDVGFSACLLQNLAPLR